MRIFRFNGLAADCYWKALYAQNPGMAQLDFASQKQALENNPVYDTGAWERAFRQLGFEAMEVVVNAKPAQTAWAKENGVSYTPNGWQHEILKAQIKAFAPDVVYGAMGILRLGALDDLKTVCPSVKLVLNWSAAPMHCPEALAGCDIVFTSTTNLIDLYNSWGFRSELLHHAFNSSILGFVPESMERDLGVTFCGCVINRAGYHMTRQKVLEEIAGKVGLTVFMPEATLKSTHDLIDTGTKAGAYAIIRALRAIGVPDQTLVRLPAIGRAANWSDWPHRQMNRKLRPYMQPPVYGLDYYKALRRSKVALNIHADVSGDHTGNLRLFEATGMGTCLVTDWKSNLSELFEIDKEVVAFKSADECVEKAVWLMDHPTEREEIAQAGQRRVLRDHTHLKRAEQISGIIERELGRL